MPLGQPLVKRLQPLRVKVYPARIGRGLVGRVRGQCPGLVKRVNQRGKAWLVRLLIAELFNGTVQLHQGAGVVFVQRLRGLCRGLLQTLRV